MPLLNRLFQLLLVLRARWEAYHQKVSPPEATIIIFKQQFWEMVNLIKVASCFQRQRTEGFPQGLVKFQPRWPVSHLKACCLSSAGLKYYQLCEILNFLPSLHWLRHQQEASENETQWNPEQGSTRQTKPWQRRFRPCSRGGKTKFKLFYGSEICVRQPGETEETPALCGAIRTG